MSTDKIPEDKKEYMHSLNIPILESFDDVARVLRLSKKLVYWLTKEDAEGKYQIFFKRKKDGGLREIDAPAGSLKTVQTWILHNILVKIKYSEYSYGFAKGCGYDKKSPQFLVAQKHRYNLFLLKLDIKDFYPSITRNSVFYLFRKIGYPISVSNYLTNICTWQGHLPQGAPTSPYMANLICRRLDKRVAGYCNKNNIVYTRYADDLMFSSDDYDLLHHTYSVIKRIVESEGFVLNEKKTRFSGNNRRKDVLGITINDRYIKSPKKMKRLLRAMIHKAIATGNYEDKDKIKGYIAYINSIEGNYIPKVKKYIKHLVKSELSLYPDLVEAYNNNKFYSDDPDMQLKKYYDFGFCSSDEGFEEEHFLYLGKIEQRKHPDQIETVQVKEGRHYNNLNENPFE